MEADLFVLGSNGHITLHYVARISKFEIIKFIIGLVLERQIFDVNVKDNRQFTLRHIIVDEKIHPIVSCKNFTKFYQFFEERCGY